MTQTALIVGAGSGLSAALARCFAQEGFTLALAARNRDKLAELRAETGAHLYGCDATVPEQVAQLFQSVAADLGAPDVVIYNPSLRVTGPLVDLDPAEVERVLAVTGAILFTGASAGVKGYPRSAPFAMGKFALRGLCQSMARELAPQNIHVAHFVIDGIIRSATRGAPFDDPERTLDPMEIAKTYLAIAHQHPSAWTWEMELRPASETF